MKFYCFSPPVIDHLRSDDNKDIDFPFEVSDEEREIISHGHSSFVWGRSGTGKTTILTAKLFEREGAHERSFGGKGDTAPYLGYDQESEGRSIVMDRAYLRQLFVTVSPKLCQSVNQHIAGFKRCETSIFQYTIFFFFLHTAIAGVYTIFNSRVSKKSERF